MSIIKVKNIITEFGERRIHDGISFNVNKGEIFALLGESGAGKSVLMKKIIMLMDLDLGDISVLDINLKNISRDNISFLRLNCGVSFQFGALFSSLTIGENISVQLREYTDLSDDMINELIASKIELVGLKPHVVNLYPSEISGGMVKRAALARALIMEPKILFLDEPTSGLDPVGARKFDELISNIKNTMGITVFMITHDLESILNIVDRMAIIADKKIAVEGNLEKVLKSKHPFVKEFFKNEENKES